MIKVLIADDEPKVIQLIVHLVDWGSLDMEIVALAGNGDEAYELICRHEPDIVITDIRMPGLSGIDLIGKARERFPFLQFIIISGYKHFEYVHSAIKYGVSDYLLKPIRKAELMTTLGKMRLSHQQRLSILSERDRVQKFVSDTQRRRRAELFDALLKGRRRGLTAAEYGERYGYAFQEGEFLVALLKIDGDYDAVRSDGMPVLMERIEGITLQSLEPLCHDVGCEFMQSTLAIAANYEPARREDIREALRGVFDEVRMQGGHFLVASFTMAVGEPVTEPDSLADSWFAADRILSERLLLGCGAFYEGAEFPEVGAALTGLISDTSRQLESAIEVMDADALDTVLREASGKLLMLARLTGADVLFFCDTIAASYLTLMQKAGLDVAGGGRFRDDFMDRAEVVGSAQDLLDLLAQTLLESFGGLLRARDEMDARPILHAKQYIKENYAQPIHLEDVAAKEGFNPSYFSTLFKKETGRTFKEYLHDVRMGEAKRLLRDTNLPVSAVCECVGYTDLKHFSGSFRQTTGIKPSEFRKLYARGGIS